MSETIDGAAAFGRIRSFIRKKYGTQRKCARVLFLEVKTPSGRLHDSQRERIPEIEQAGAGVVVVRSVDDVFHALKEAGVPVRATPA